MDNEIAKHLGLAPLEDVIEGEVISVRETTEIGPANLDKDYNYARDNFYNVIEKGTRALEDLLDVATQSQHPRAYEVIATTIKTLIDANKDLVELSMKKQQAETADPMSAPNKIVNNTLFVGTTSDLQKILRDMKNE